MKLYNFQACRRRSNVFKLLSIKFMVMSLAACSGSKHAEIPQSREGVTVVAGTESSAGGGNAVVCFKDPSTAKAVQDSHGNMSSKYIDHIESVEMLDLYHARQTRNRQQKIATQLIEIDESKQETPDEYVGRILRRFQTLIPLFAHELRRGQNQITENSFHFSATGINRIDDAKSDAQLGPNCALVTMAAQNSMSDKGELIVDERLYHHKKHSQLSRAVLLLHEYLYLIARKQAKVTDSKGVRHAISYLILKSPKFKLSEVISALNAMVPTSDSPFRSSEDYRLFDIANRQVIHFLDYTYPAYQTQHPADIVLFERANKLLNRVHLSCLSNTPMGCLFPLMRMTDELIRDLPAKELKEVQLLLVESLRKEGEELDKVVKREWQESDPLSFLGKNDGMNFRYALTVLRRTIVGIPSYILPKLAENGPVNPEFKKFLSGPGPFVLIRRTDIVDFIVLQWKEHIRVSDPEVP